MIKYFALKKTVENIPIGTQKKEKKIFLLMVKSENENCKMQELLKAQKKTAEKTICWKNDDNFTQFLFKCLI